MSLVVLSFNLIVQKIFSFSFEHVNLQSSNEWMQLTWEFDLTHSLNLICSVKRCLVTTLRSFPLSSYNDVTIHGDCANVRSAVLIDARAALWWTLSNRAAAKQCRVPISVEFHCSSPLASTNETESFDGCLIFFISLALSAINRDFEKPFVVAPWNYIKKQYTYK